MQFNTPIPTQPLPNYHESSPLKPTRDSDATAKLWLRDQIGMLHGKALTQNIGRIYRELRKLRTRALSQFLAHPFKVYNVPAENCANPKDAWRTFQVSGGLCGSRSLYSYPLANSADPLSFQNPFVSGGNGEQQLCVYGGTDGFYNRQVTGGSGTLFTNLDYQYENYGAIDGYTVQTLSTTAPVGGYSGPTQFLLSTDVLSEPYVCASFWIEITDDPTNGVSAQINGQMVAGEDNWPAPFPSSKNIIPLAIVIPATKNVYQPATDIGIPFNISQLVFDNVLNRYPVACGRLGARIDGGGNASGLIYRGDWEGDSLSGQVFYDGDFVVDSSQSVHVSLIPSGTGTFKNLKQFLHMGISVETDTPVDGANWLQFGGLLQTA